MTEPIPLKAAVQLPPNFKIDEVRGAPRTTGIPTPPPDLGPLSAFRGTWRGSGFSSIFRPDSPVTPTVLPEPVPPGDNILELNLTSEVLSFSDSLGSVPNRGRLAGQADIFLNGVPYLQTVSDVTTGTAIPIHLEPGLWVIVPLTDNPDIPKSTLARMASIPHGTTINAQGTFTPFTGTPVIPAVGITPSVANAPGQPKGQLIPFASQKVVNDDTPRIPQDLTQLNAEGKITQAHLDDPNQYLRDANAGRTILGGTVIEISTFPAAPLFGGGADNIAFLLGAGSALTNPIPPVQNAQSTEMTATFWIETVEYTLEIPIHRAGDPPFEKEPKEATPDRPSPGFIVKPPIEIGAPREITVQTTQIQYSQNVTLNFAGLSWPHVSVATLVPAAPLPVPPEAW